MAEEGAPTGAIQEALAASPIARDLARHLASPANRQSEVAPGVSGVRAAPSLAPVIIETNQLFPGGAIQSQRILLRAYGAATGRLSAKRQVELEVYADPQYDGPQLFTADDHVDVENSLWTDRHLFGTLTKDTIERLAWAKVLIPKRGDTPLVYKLWLDHSVEQHVYRSACAIKADAARAVFNAAGNGIVWAVADSGIDSAHPHFVRHGTLVNLPEGLQHHDFTDEGPSTVDGALIDTNGHGTHVAGIIAGETVVETRGEPAARITTIKILKESRPTGAPPDAGTADAVPPRICGVAPHCKLVSLKVLKGAGGTVGLLLAAIGFVQRTNEYGANLRIHGINLSLGYPFEAESFAAGQSPLCAAVNRLVKSGVVVVVSAGNSGYGLVQVKRGPPDYASHLASISDPGNAELAITVGSTHRSQPHTYGISWFSAKGPTADGRNKPDLVAPGERIVSCAVHDQSRSETALFKEDSGTSMAAPHVSGAIAAFLSAHPEFIGQPERVKQIFMQSATDLGRRADFQGAGLVDALRAMQSV